MHLTAYFDKHSLYFTHIMKNIVKKYSLVDLCPHRIPLGGMFKNRKSGWPATVSCLVHFSVYICSCF